MAKECNLLIFFVLLSQVQVMRQLGLHHTQWVELQATPLLPLGGHINSRPPTRDLQMGLELQLPPIHHDHHTNLSYDVRLLQKLVIVYVILF